MQLNKEIRENEPTIYVIYVKKLTPEVVYLTAFLISLISIFLQIFLFFP